MEVNQIIGPEQAGFGSGFSTTDHMFALKYLIDIYLSKRKRLYCCYIDHSKAFDTISRSELWSKLLKCNVSGKIFRVVYNMYKSAKSCVAINGLLTDNFSCLIGVRQGENLSPLLFSLYLNDLQEFLQEAHMGLKEIRDLATHTFDNNLCALLKLYILLYADDTVLLAESPKDLQNSINLMEEYCHLWKLKINVSKSKVTVFSRGRIRKRPEFYFGENKLDVVDHYKYLGLNFNFNGKFTVAKKELYEKGNRAMFSLLRKSRQLQLPIAIQLPLFDVLVKPVLLYGCEVWAHEGTDILEKLHLRFCKYVLGVNKSTCTNMVYGELGATPLSLITQSRMVMF